jgi:NADPH-dependent 2,4-dienoyl-CoA reductase/sulfur reductase-like enzyme
MTVIVVGAGIAGLTVARELAAAHPVTVIDRLPAVGGVLGYEHRQVSAAAMAGRAAGATMLLGTTALRWQAGRLLVAGPAGIEWLAADHLVIAAGARPAVAAEQRLAGPRLAGVYPAPLAIHLAEAGVGFGQRACVIGVGNWAKRATEVLEHRGTEVTGISADADADGEAEFGSSRWAGWTAVEVGGVRRVSSLTVVRNGIRRRIDCDSVVLADGIRPLRNVDGALSEGRGDVSFVQPARASLTADEVIEDARLAATAMLAPAERTVA